MKKGLLLLWVITVLGAAGCKKDAGVVPAGGNYLPLSEGNTWKYSYASDGGTTDTLTIKMTGGTTLIGGKTYYNAASTYKNGSTSGYFYVGNHNYATRTVDAASGNSLELVMLNDTASVGYSWITDPGNNGQIGGVKARTVNTIKEKNISRIINGHTFNRVIHTQVQLQYDFGSGFETTITYQFYMADGVGLIETDANTLDTLHETETLFGYTVK
ncbi:MAG TPA: hypothetical protein VHC47_08995 [Mucilaginibacter sp.]|nr:hypothetical protein [Mucilaginibacter sp.]